MTSTRNKAFSKVLCAIALVMAIGFAGACKKEAGADDALTASGSWRYKITVSVETPEGIKSGYAIREMSNSRSKNEINLPQSVHPAKIKGEAVVVDLGARGRLFALLTGYKYGPDHAKTILFDVFPSGSGGDSAAGIRFYRDLKAGPKAMTPGQYPVLVMFKDINDPKTVTKVMDIERDINQPANVYIYNVKADRFEELFGKGVKLKEITMEMTDEPVTWSVDQFLSWLPDYYSQQLDGQKFQTIDSLYPVASSLSSGAFSAGKNRN
jgi:hypothetical protein